MQVDSINAAQKADSVQRQLFTSPDDIYNEPVDSLECAHFLEEIYSYDTVTANGSFIKHFTDADENIYVYWGTNSGEIIDTMIDQGGGWGRYCAEYGGEGEGYLMLSATGKGLMNLWLLPLDREDTVQYYHSVVKLDLTLGLILLSEEDDNFTLVNFYSGHHKQVTLPEIERTAYSIPLFEEIKFQYEKVVLKWSDEDGMTYASEIML